MLRATLAVRPSVCLSVTIMNHGSKYALQHTIERCLFARPNFAISNLEVLPQPVRDNYYATPVDSEN